MTQFNPLLVGMYEPAEVARMLNLSPQTLRRWAFGYTQARADEKVWHPPVVERCPNTEGDNLAFVDLVELWFVRRFLEEGISFREIRDVYRTVRAETQTDHPFAMDGEWVALGRRIIKRHYTGDDRAVSLEPVSKQGWFDELVKQVGTQLDFGDSGLAHRWFPIGKDKLVVVDPSIGFGRPTVLGHSISTFNVWDLYQAERKDLDLVRDWFNLTDQEVQDAVEWEEQIRSTKKAA